MKLSSGNIGDSGASTNMTKTPVFSTPQIYDYNEEEGINKLIYRFEL